MEKKKVVIIGAGPAGLTLAYYLLKNSKDYQIVMLEQSDRVGGISKTLDFNGYRMDIGTHRFFTKNDEIEQIWEELLPIQSKPAYDDIILEKNKKFKEVGPDPEKEDKTMLIKERVTRIYYGKKFYDYPVTINLTTIKNMGFVTLVKAGGSYLKSCIVKKTEDSLENFYINRFGKVLYSMFFESYTEKVWGIHPSKISADWGAQRVKDLSISEVIKDMFKKMLGIKKNENTETSLIEQFIYPKLGAGQMYEEMAKKIEEMGGKIYLNSKVKEIQAKDGLISKVVYEKDDEQKEMETDICVSTMPIKELFENLKGTYIPDDIYEIATNLPYRAFMSVGIITDKLKLKNTTKRKTVMNMIPDSWIYVQEPGVKMGRLQVFNNWSPYIFRNKEDIEKEAFLSFEYFCSENDEYWNMSDEEFIKFAEQEAIKIGLIDENSIKQAIRVKLPKAYPAYFGTYNQFDKVRVFLDKISNLYCIGRNGQHRYNNMDHSMLTGLEAARNIIEGKKDKSNIWNVNTEKEYNEKK